MRDCHRLKSYAKATEEHKPVQESDPQTLGQKIHHDITNTTTNQTQSYQTYTKCTTK